MGTSVEIQTLHPADWNGVIMVIIRNLSCALMAFALLGATAAHAGAPGYTTADVNFRTGPDIDFPSVGVIPEGDDVFVVGCLRDESWCDVRWDGDRGWVYSEYLAFEYRGETVLLPDVGPEVFSIPIIAFAVASYWDRHYVGRPWYRKRDHWYNFRVRPRRGWRAPPRGQRTRGWWRKAYRTPHGMKAPPRQNWVRPHRDERRNRIQRNRGDRHDGRRGNDRQRGEIRRNNDQRGNAKGPLRINGRVINNGQNARRDGGQRDDGRRGEKHHEKRGKERRKGGDRYRQ